MMRAILRQVLLSAVMLVTAILVVASGVAANAAAHTSKSSAASASLAHSGWDATWAASPMAPTTLLPNLAVAGVNDQTVRNVIFTSVGGSELRVRLSNTFGTSDFRAVGDSITDGFASKDGGNDRWPNFLARRLDAKFGAEAPGVVDEGIGGNRVLNDSACFGVNALARFNRDVLSQTGVRDVILLEGINDIGFSQTPNTGCTAPNTDVSATQIINGYEQLIGQAHAHGLKIFGATLTSFEGAGYWSPAAEAKREAVNSWIRTSGAFDGVIDFARAAQDAQDPLYFNPAYNSGDNLHPND